MEASFCLCNPEVIREKRSRLLFLENSFAALIIYITTSLMDDGGKGKEATIIRKKFMFHHGRLDTQTILLGKKQIAQCAVLKS